MNWLQNVDKHLAPTVANTLRKERGISPANIRLGKPKQVRNLSVEQLEKRGLVGLYEITKDKE